MSHMLKRTYMILLALLAILPSAAQSNDDRFTLEISLDKQTYIMYEPIWLEVAMTNTSADTLRTHGVPVDPDHHQFTIEIRDQAGALATYVGGRHGDLGCPGRLVLDPGEQEHGSFELAVYYQFSEGDVGLPRICWMFPHFPIGEYSVLVRYEGVVSNVLSFSVVPPEGDDEEAVRMIEGASEVLRRDRDSGAAAQAFRDIVERYPSSVFAMKCDYLSEVFDPRFRNGTRDGAMTWEALDVKMLPKYPDDGWSRSWLRGITHDMEDNEKLEFLDSLMERFPETKAARFAGQMKEGLLRGRKGE